MSGGREIARHINYLLSFPFIIKIATKDFHPKDHISFDTSHSFLDKKPAQSSIEIFNPLDKDQTHEIPIWPVHCVQGTPGAEIIPEIDVNELDYQVEKGKDRRVEMFSGFADVFGNKSSTATNMDLADLLKKSGITDVFVTGIAGDFCVRQTALDANKEGFRVYVLEEATRSVDPSEKGWGAAKKEMEDAGVIVMSIDDPRFEKIWN